MKHVCLNCNANWTGTISLEKCKTPTEGLMAGHWLTTCPCCGKVIHVSPPVAKIIVCFADDSKRPASFKDNFDGKDIMHYHAFDTINDFMTWWIPQTENWDGMWYYVFDNGVQICSGAVDPYDVDIWREHFGTDIINEAIAACEHNGIHFDDPTVTEEG